ncbi:MAG: fatty acyl-AMP ligase, partial [Deltaproteobacteria bacterium]|nr:fatty acyl-AMP ligase [Deltaproteobacteria bacterium]
MSPHDGISSQSAKMQAPVPVDGRYPARGVVEALDQAGEITSQTMTFVGARLADGKFGDLTWTYAELRAQVQKRAHHLMSLGLKKGDRVALVVPDGEQFVPSFLAALWAGLVPVPLYPPLSLGKLDAFMESLVNILNVAQPRVLIAGDKVDQILWGVVGKVPTLEKLVTAADLAKDVSGKLLSERPVHSADEDTAFLQFTSGSTAAPKGVMVTHGSLKANAKAIMIDGLGADNRRDKGVSWLPLYHDMGLIGFVIAPLTQYVSVVYIPTLSFIKNATLWMETISKHKGTISFAPNFAYALVTKRARAEQLKKWDLSQMRVFGCGAEPINPDTMRAFVKAFEPAGLKPEALLPCYGMAEATLAMAFVNIDDPLRTDRIDAHAYHADRKAKPAAHDATLDGKDGTPQMLEVVNCGKTFPGPELVILDDEATVLPDRTVGEICFKGPSVAAGYFNNAEASKAAGMQPAGGFLRTGDLGYLADGEVFISGRIKDILILNGRNYYPQRIEWAVEEVPGVRKGSAVVFSRPGKSSEEVVVVVETRAQDPEALKAAIVARVNDELQLAVSDVQLVPPGALPKTSSGKLQRRKTREQYLTGKLGKEGVRTMGAMGSKLIVMKHVARSLVGKARHNAR